jgi:rRNA maturation endonuclease Nob1
MARLKTFLPLRFDRIKVCGRYIPSEESINLTWSEIGNDSDKIEFVKSNNILVYLVENVDPEDSDDIKRRKLIKEFVQNYQKQGEVMGKDVTELIQSLAVVNWFAAVFAEMKEGNVQALKKNESKLEKLFKNGKIPLKITAPKYTYLKELPEYKKAFDILVDWYDNILVLWEKDLQIQELMIAEFKIRMEIAENLEKSKNEYLNICQFCKKIFLTKRGGGHKTCGSVDCERRYSAATSRNNRSSPFSTKKTKPL